MFNKTGVYIIENTATNKCYIGSTLVGFEERFKRHLCSLRRNKHHSKKLQRSYNKHGKDSFKFRILEVCDDVREKEQEWIDMMVPFYNMSLTVDGGVDNHTYESKLKISKLQGGKPIHICDKKGNTLKVVNFQHEAATFVGGSQPKVWRCLQGIGNTHMGHRFRYAGEDFAYVSKKRTTFGMLGKKHSKETRSKMGLPMARGKFNGILEIYEKGKLLNKFLSLKECADYYNLKVTGISNSLKTKNPYKGYHFNKKPLVADRNDLESKEDLRRN